MSENPATSTSYVERLVDVRITMRDGVELSANLYLPAKNKPVSTVLLRTPYSVDDNEITRLGLDGYIESGYAVILQSVRGRGKSGGDFGFFFVEGADGFDSIEWIARQEWSDGKVAMDGGSYMGTVQWLAARERPPHLTCILPCVPAGDYFNEIPYMGGALHLDAALIWQAAQQGVEISFSKNNQKNLEDYRPLTRVGEKLGVAMPFLDEFLLHSTLDEYWNRIYFTEEDFSKVKIPIMIATGWFDGDQAGSLFYWNGIENNSDYTKENSRLIIGPWIHHQCYLGGELRLEQLEFSDSVLYPLREARLAFLDAFLKDDDARLKKIPRVQTYITGENQWRSFTEYPPAQIQYREMFLGSDGDANTSTGSGSLSWEPPFKSGKDAFIYDPLDPVPYCPGGGDLQEQEKRQDILVYSSEPLPDSLIVIGPITVKLHAASDALDTDFVVRLVDVYPDGRAINLTHTRGVIRARYRNSYTTPELLLPGRIEAFDIRLTDIGHCFLSGHRIRLEVTSSCFPLVDPNTNTGGNFATDTTCKKARQTIYHRIERSSYLLLPIVKD